jgi:hypothetical protein
LLRGYCTTDVVKQRPGKKESVVFCRSAKQQLNSNRGTVFSVQSVPRYYNHDNLSKELIVGQSTADMKVSTGAENIAKNRHQATTGEYKGN